MPQRLGLLALCLVLLSGCGGGGDSTPVNGGGGSVIAAGPMRMTGTVGQPQVWMGGPLTTYALTGNITSANYVDTNPTLQESELLYSRMGPAGNEILGVNFGDGSVRTIIPNMPQYATNLCVDPSGRYCYYIRSNNLQRTDIRDGTSNTLIAGVDSFAFTEDGSQLVYRKNGTDQLWHAASNGSGQTLYGSYPTEQPQVLGCVNAQYMFVRGTGALAGRIYLMNVSTGALISGAGYNNATIYWMAYSYREHAVYVHFYQSIWPVGEQYRIERIGIIIPPNTIGYEPFLKAGAPLPIVGAMGGPEDQTLAGWTDSQAEAIDPYGTPMYSSVHNTRVFGCAWVGARTSVKMAGASTPFATGVGGMMFSEVGPTMPTVVVVDAVTRNSVTITSLSNGTDGNSVYRVDCDDLSRLSYANGGGYAWTHLIGAPSGLKGAVISFQAETGKIGNVVTFNKKPTVIRAGKGWQVTGDLSEVIDVKRGTKRPAGQAAVLP